MRGAMYGTWTFPVDGEYEFRVRVVNFRNGPHRAVATATDAASNTATDSTTFTVAALAAAISITTPVDGSLTNDPTPPISGTSSVISGTVTVAVDGGAPVTVPTNATGDWALTPATVLADGPHAALATATEAAGNVATDTTNFTVDTIAPGIVITTPEDGSVTNDSTPPFTGTSDVINGTISLSVDG
ncbi:MAG: adhesin, partial [Chitinophagaceae bacterium]|nr:adhesin [Rubrivivax sp.]